MARESYLDHWLHDIRGHQRNQRPPASRREALLDQLCVDLGFCDTGLTTEDLADATDPVAIVELVLRGEGLDPPGARFVSRFGS